MALTVSATDTEVQKPVNVIYESMLLRNARPLAPYFLGTQKGTLMRNGGSATVKWRRYNTSADHASGIAPSTTALSELTGNASYMQGRTPDVVHFSDVTAAAAKYGQFYILNEEVDVFLPNGTTAGIVNTLAISAGRSANQLQRNIAEDNVTLIYAGGAASDGAVTSAITAASIKAAVQALAVNSAMPFSPMSAGSVNIGTNPVLPAFWGLTSPYVASDIAGLSGFKSVESYAAHVDVMPGEIGVLGDAGFTVRFVSSPDASNDADSGGAVGSTGLKSTTASLVDLFTTVIYGMDAFGSVGLGQTHTDGIYRSGDDSGVFSLIAKGVGTGKPSGTDDPFDEITTLAYKFWHAGAALNANFSRGIRSGATDLS